jgi:hypothetical protein
MPYPDQWEAWTPEERRNVVMRQRSWPKGTAPTEMEDYAAEIVEGLDDLVARLEELSEAEREKLVAQALKQLDENGKRLAKFREQVQRLIAARGPLIMALVLLGETQASVAKTAGIQGSLVSATIGTSDDKHGTSGRHR